MTEHTPTPWKLTELESARHGYDGWKTFTIRDGKTNGCLAVVGEVDRQFDTVNEANAEFICLTANCHDYLVRALKNISINLKLAAKVGDTHNGYMSLALETAEAALAKTKKGT